MVLVLWPSPQFHGPGGELTYKEQREKSAMHHKTQAVQGKHTIHYSPNQQSSASHVMSGRQISPLCLHYSSSLTAFLVSF